MFKKTNSLNTTSLLLLCFFIALFVVIPAFIVVLISFLKADDLGAIKTIFTLENYTKLMSPVYAEVIYNSIKVAIITTGLAFVLAYPLAYIISKLNKKAQIVLFLLIILPYWTNSLIRTYSFMVLLRADGIINKLLMLLNITNKPLQLLYTDSAVVMVMVYLFLPVMFLPVYSSVEKLDKTYIEASKDLGAGKLYTFFKIILPLSMPGIVAGSILVFTPCLGMFYISDLIGGGKTVLLGSIIRDQFTVTRNLPFGSALSMVMIFLAVLFIIIYYKISSGGEKNE